MADVNHIVGSAEPLTPEETEVRLRELEEWGVDLSLVWASLQKRPEERLEHMLGVLRVAQELQQAWQVQRMNNPPGSDSKHDAR
ncbi:MAG TPA: hypothetical protein VFE42_26780 [Chloroflexota bacterium]|nr:hypothetical protein [Chloroflexota bacterium]